MVLTHFTPKKVFGIIMVRLHTDQNKNLFYNFFLNKFKKNEYITFTGMFFNSVSWYFFNESLNVSLKDR